MGLFTKTPPSRRPVAEIVSGLATMVDDLEKSNLMAADEQTAAEEAIVALQAERRLLKNEQAQAGAITSNLRALLGLDLDGDGEPDDLDRAIASLGASTETVETVGGD